MQVQDTGLTISLMPLQNTGQIYPAEHPVLIEAVRDPTTLTIFQQYGPNHLGLWYSAMPEHQIALTTSDCVPLAQRRGADGLGGRTARPGQRAGAGAHNMDYNPARWP